MAKVVLPVNEQYIGEMRRYSMDWSKDLARDKNVYPADAREKIVTSSWAISADSPVSGVNFVASGFDDDLGVTWVSIESDGTLIDADVVWLINTIETTGLNATGSLSTTTSTQRLIKQYNVKFLDC